MSTIYYSLDEQMVEACELNFDKFMDDICEREEASVKRIDEQSRAVATWGSYTQRYGELPQNRIFVR